MFVSREKERSSICKKTITVTLLLMIFLFTSATAVSAKSFPDTENHWAKHSIEFITNEGIFVGMPDNTFSPNLKMTRGMFVSVLARMQGIDLSYYNYTVFSDVSLNSYYGTAVTWAYQNDIIFGMSATNFSPESPVTREQICLILENYLNHADNDGMIGNVNATTQGAYADDYKISSWAKNAVYTMKNYGLLVGDGRGFRPQDSVTRAEGAVILSRLKGQFFEVYVPKPVPTPTPTPTPVKTYLGTYRLTCYCAGCNSPAGSRQTASGIAATHGEYGTIAVSSQLYRELGAGTVLYIDGVGYRKIQDIHGNTSNVIDVYVNHGPCTCWTNSLSGRTCNVYVVR